MSQKTEDRSQKAEGRNQATRFWVKIALVCLLSSVFCLLPAFGSEKWPGVDETVVEKYAKEHGREARDPLVNTDQGDLLLFVFLIAGTAAGFAAGYYWRILMVEKAPARKEEQNTKG
jgi:cobalt/nickel transport system permease protein